MRHCPTTYLRSYFASLAANPVSRHMVWENVQEKFDELVRRFEGSFALTRLVEYSVRSLTTQKDADAVRAFFADKDTKRFNTGLEQGLDSVRASAFWLSQDRSDVQAWLQSAGYLS